MEIINNEFIQKYNRGSPKKVKEEPMANVSLMDVQTHIRS